MFDHKLKKLIEKEVNKQVSNIVVSKLPNDIALGEDQFLFISVEFGDFPKEMVYKHLQVLSERLQEQGVTQFILYPTFNGVCKVDFKKINAAEPYIYME